MCNGENEVCQLCRRDVEHKSCSATCDHKSSCGEHGFEHSLPIERSRPDICPDCTSDGYRELHKTFETLARPVKENIVSLQEAAAANQHSLNKVSRIYLRRVNESRAIIGSPDTDWSIKHSAYRVVDAARKYMQPLMEHHSRSAARLAEDLEREKKQLLAMQRHHLAELNFFREEDSLSMTPHPARTSSPTQPSH